MLPIAISSQRCFEYLSQTFSSVIIQSKVSYMLFSFPHQCEANNLLLCTEEKGDLAALLATSHVQPSFRVGRFKDVEHLLLSQSRASAPVCLEALHAVKSSLLTRTPHLSDSKACLHLQTIALHHAP